MTNHANAKPDRNLDPGEARNIAVVKPSPPSNIRTRSSPDTYFVPCLLAGLFNVLAVVLGTLYLEETLPSKVLKPQKRSAEISHQDSLEDQERPDPAERARTLKELLTRDLVTLLISFGFMALENSAWMAIIPLFSYSPRQFSYVACVEDGGLGLTLDQIDKNNKKLKKEIPDE
ncbi:uncharacterized protein PGTG_17822 [Puccinia graminis f. sp. tritici CRL 75-36-700-3]|uniref:Uncharacterized protein n=1 Tax=Puccinia graminis f. sp. tritici (strain CRL 75-36-700-3 / race SCCL) TaxID=418459 RepID=E3L5J7_PUCGT|nr:uncharacterized protein PGTG_17822 [Puccinia graminis f. sp. tritici CRL 75-36-700-3]EFP91822.1 hypothetical protein PGTG_17822 [Puccinia graminis f. sp. tritici CRL 75-36-700-3]